MPGAEKRSLFPYLTPFKLSLQDMSTLTFSECRAGSLPGPLTSMTGREVHTLPVGYNGDMPPRENMSDASLRKELTKSGRTTPRRYVL